MGRFPFRDSGPWEKLIRGQNLAVAIQQRFVAVQDSIELVLEASKMAIPENIQRLCSHETLMRNFLVMHERSTFSPKRSGEDKHLKAWLEKMQKTGAKRLFPNITTAANVNESIRVLLRERALYGTKLALSVVCDHVRAAYQTSSEAGVKNVHAAIQLLTDAKPARVLMAQARQPFSNLNGRECPAQGGRVPSVDEMGVADLRQEVAESSNTIYQLCKNAEPF